MDRTAIRPLVAGNWKMNGLSPSLAELAALKDHLARAPVAGADLLVCPPATLLARARDALAGTDIALGAQDCHPVASGAHTGERRIDHGEVDCLVNAKAKAAHRAGLTAMICVGETQKERLDGSAFEVVGRQLKGSVPLGSQADHTVIAYEPVWAIGTGLTPTRADVAEMHGFIRNELGTLMDEAESGRLRILYGGSVKPANARELLSVADVNGALVGGASLNASDLYAILATYCGRTD